MKPLESYALRNRILLYLTGMGADEVASLEIAAECLRRSGPGAAPEHAMTTLRQLLDERDLAFRCFEPEGRLHSYPPLKRQAMVSRWTGGASLFVSVKRLAARFVRGGAEKRA